MEYITRFLRLATAALTAMSKTFKLCVVCARNAHLFQL